MAVKINPSSINRKKISWLLEQDLNVKLQAMQHHLEIRRMLINDILEYEVIQYAGQNISKTNPTKGNTVVGAIIQTAMENSKSLSELLSGLVECGLKYENACSVWSW